MAVDLCIGSGGFQLPDVYVLHLRRRWRFASVPTGVYRSAVSRIFNPVLDHVLYDRT